MRIQLRLDSKSLGFTTQVDVILPQCGQTKDPAVYYDRDNKLPMMMLLHGGTGDCSEWLRLTSVELLADEYGMGFVCPTASCSSYLNEYRGFRFADWIYDELYELMHVMFPFSREREKNYAAGLSMGGYGAYKAALKYPEKFGYCAGLSSGVYLPQRVANGEDPVGGAEIVFGPADKIIGGDADLFQAARDLKASGKDAPKLFWVCGNEDFGLDGNLLFRNLLQELGYDLTCVEAPGAHTWDFWDTHIKDVMEWIRGEGNIQHGRSFGVVTLQD